jgi:uncharacterized protein YdeI (YjbR/CyaY-like superfamily)
MWFCCFCPTCSEAGESMNPKIDTFLKKAKLKAAFKALTPGRQRGYLFYFSGAKQVKTIEARVQKCMKLILQGKVLND